MYVPTGFVQFAEENDEGTRISAETSPTKMQNPTATPGLKQWAFSHAKLRNFAQEQSSAVPFC
jgi:hypothetical protein